MFCSFRGRSNSVRCKVGSICSMFRYITRLNVISLPKFLRVGSTNYMFLSSVANLTAPGVIIIIIILLHLLVLSENPNHACILCS